MEHYENIIDEISKNVANHLFKTNNEVDGIKNQSEKYLILPKRRNAKIRVSEQEARFLFIHELEKEKIYYSVETPTSDIYNFKNPNADEKNKSSGSLDLCIYKKDEKNEKKLVRDIIVEFKAHTKECQNDFEKLLHEDENGILFHLLERAGNGTLKYIATPKGRSRTIGVFGHYEEDIEKVKNCLSKDKKSNWFLKIVVCCLNPQFLITKTLRKDDLDNLDEFFSINYKVENNGTIKFNTNNWEVLA
jgi:hypothetical protein